MASSSSSSYLLRIFLAISAVHFYSSSPNARASTHPLDVQVLKQLKGTIDPSTIPAGSCVASWDFSADPCDSLFSSRFTCGFRCDENDAVSNLSRLTEIALDSAGYSGSLAAVSWPGASSLRTLDFSSNGFSGPVPASLSGLTRLSRLGLSRNSLSGPVPAQLGSLASLEEMYLDGNALTGEIPASFGGLWNLKRLEIQGNRLRGGFPELSRLGSLSYLDASDNEISGEIPPALPPALVELIVRNNRIQGNFPATAVANLAFLQVIDLSHNNLVGIVPASLFAHPSLEQLTLSHNQFGSVEAPGDMGLASQLISIDLSNNQFRGALPEFMGLMPRLSALSLENNMFTGFIPSQYAMKVLETGTGQFERLLLGGNYLYGPIPGGFLGLKAGSIAIRLGDNCMYRCPLRWFFCEGGVQKPLMKCRGFVP